jgi:hypothetical protein
MALELKKAIPVALRSLGLDERWLQDRIAEDPSLLGLGDLDVIRRERNQGSGGRIDFLMHDPEDDIRFEIEIMLGALDETHIIRTIEYWDLERQRYPTHEHRAVIVAEEITSRFFNVIRLLNQAVPIIALQLNALKFGDAIFLQFTKVLDVYESVDEVEDGGGEQADRRYWEKRANPASLEAADGIISMVPSQKGSPRVTYNRGHIAVGTVGRNFCWLRPRKSLHCHVEIKPGTEGRDEALRKLEEAGIPATPYKTNAIKFNITKKDLELSSSVLRAVFEQTERWARAEGSAAGVGEA